MGIVIHGPEDTNMAQTMVEPDVIVFGRDRQKVNQPGPGKALVGSAIVGVSTVSEE